MENNNTNNKTVGILSANMAKTVEKLKKNFLRIGVYVLIGGVVVGALLIMFGSTKNGEYIAKTMGMLIVFAIMMLVSSNNFKMLETGKKEVQIFALIGLIMNFIWGVLWILLIWNLFGMFQPCDYTYSNSSSFTSTCSYGFSMAAKIAIASTDLSILGFVGSNVLAIDNRDRKNAIMPLKVTAIIALCYDSLYGVFMVMGGSGLSIDPRMASLAGFAGLVWIVTWIVAASLSRGARKKTEKEATATLVASAMEAQKVNSGKPEESEEEMRKRLEEKVRKEMEMEKEIRTKMESGDQEVDLNESQDADTNQVVDLSESQSVDTTQVVDLNDSQGTDNGQTDEVHDTFQTE